jgi:malonate transporter and related proteins
MIGMVLTPCDLEVPRLLHTSLTLIGVGAGAGGVALFLTGLILSSRPFKLNGNVASGTLLKNVVPNPLSGEFPWISKAGTLASVASI